ncbi:hypothetical protein A0H81_07844 [Grifola frondosa]|uniref:C2H2-type domain-containing protein n=1 Tax=Grifola frondosa TaxID=5627 RepID=A0A1C7M694_GRIFR|nr:hypothetical protein A0H81_07844 [Grifola frondosa]
MLHVVQHYVLTTHSYSIGGVPDNRCVASPFPLNARRKIRQWTMDISQTRTPPELTIQTHIMADVIDLTNISDSDEDFEQSYSEIEHGSSQASESSAGAPLPAPGAGPPRLDDTAREQLRIAIATVSGARLRAVVIALAERIPAAEHALFEELVAMKRNKEKTTTEPVPRWEVCVNCDEEFDMGTHRVAGECRYHSGDLEADYDSFVDWDESCHGPIDTPANRRSYPENFTWNCCDGHSLAEDWNTHLTSLASA